MLARERDTHTHGETGRERESHETERETHGETERDVRRDRQRKRGAHTCSEDTLLSALPDASSKAGSVPKSLESRLDTD